MGLAGFHALGRHCPELRPEVELLPRREPDLAGASGRQDREFEGPGAHAFARPELRHELGNVGPGAGRHDA